MPVLPRFDYYAELQSEQTASLEQITSAYRRLALVHHPDRNHGNEEQATVAFQRLQQAYEILSDPVKRIDYDRMHGSTGRGRSDFNDSDDGGYGFHAARAHHSFFNNNNFYGDGSPPKRYYTPHSYCGRGVNRQRRYAMWESWASSRERTDPEREPAYQAAGQGAAAKVKEEERQRHMEALLEQQREKALREKVQREAKLATKLAAQDAESALKQRRHEEERALQEKRWKDANAVSKDERLQACLHSDFCAKVYMNKKFKCSVCLVKRGAVAFECPYCSVNLCQLCVSQFSTRRQKLADNGGSSSSGSSQQPTVLNECLDTSGVTQPEPTRKEEEADSKSTAATKKSKSPAGGKNKAVANQSEEKLQSAHSQSTSTESGNKADMSGDNSPTSNDRVKTQPAREGSLPVAEFTAQDATEPVVATVPSDRASKEKAQPKRKAYTRTEKLQVKQEASAQAGEVCKSVNNAAAEEGTQKPITTKADKPSVQNDSITPTQGSSRQQAQFSKGAPKPEASSKAVHDSRDAPNSNNLRKHCTKKSAESQSPQNLPAKSKSASGATQAFIRSTKPYQRMTEQLLRPALADFGAIKWIKVLPRKGLAHLEFETCEALCKAMAASPIVLDSQITVKVSQLRKCTLCTKLGHVGAYCKRPGNRTDG